mmetsp:Transcript_2736/g.7487  ORF Transcript_2736/g.7487 Transcript_2736/m.7487 type:complete len:212 (+) Transcript_2736:1076-1711(+)
MHLHRLVNILEVDNEGTLNHSRVRLGFRENFAHNCLLLGERLLGHLLRKFRSGGGGGGGGSSGIGCTPGSERRFGHIHRALNSYIGNLVGILLRLLGSRCSCHRSGFHLIHIHFHDDWCRGRSHSGGAKRFRLQLRAPLLLSQIRQLRRFLFRDCGAGPQRFGNRVLPVLDSFKTPKQGARKSGISGPRRGKKSVDLLVLRLDSLLVVLAP